MRIARVAAVSAALTTGLLCPLPAQEAPGGAVQLEPVVVTARGEATPLSKTPGSVGILGGDTIRRLAPVSISDILYEVPGVARNGDGAWGADVNIRGLSRDSVVLLIDGCRVETAADLGARFGLIDPLDVERVEVLKGPISSLYGSGSIGGVVNIITRKGRFAEQPEWTGLVSGSGMTEPGGFGGYARAGMNSPDTWVHISQSYRDYGSYEDGGGREVRNSQFSDWQTAVRAGHRLRDDFELGVNAQFFEGHEIGVPGSGTAPLPAAADVTYDSARRGLLGVTGTLTPDLDLLQRSSLNVFYEFIDREVTLDAFPVLSPLREVKPTGNNDVFGARWENCLDAGRHELTTGLDAWQREYTGTRERLSKLGVARSDKPLPDSTYGSAGAFVEDQFQAAERWTLNGGGRLDTIRVENDATENFDAGDEDDASWNLHAGTTYAVAEQVTMKLVGASGYRSASLDERFQFLDLGGGRVRLGDPGLDPERSLFGEYGVDWAGEHASFGVAAFWNELRDLIGEKVVDPATIVNANVDEARIQGVEAQGSWRPADLWAIYGNLAYAVGRDTKNDEDLSGIAPLSGVAGVKRQGLRGFWGRVETQFADRQDEVPPGVEPAAGWVTADLRVGYDVERGRLGHSVYTGVDNLFDKNYRNYLTTWRGNTFNEPGRSYVAGYALSF